MNLTDTCAAYEAATNEFLEAAASLNDDLLDRHREGEWSARQVVHHMADSETQSYARLRRLLAEPAGTLIQGYDEGAWASNATLGYASLPIAHPVAVVRAVRAASLDILRRLSSEDLARHGEHSESGRYDVTTWIDTYIDHASHHATQLLEAASS